MCCADFPGARPCALRSGTMSGCRLNHDLFGHQLEGDNAIFIKTTKIIRMSPPTEFTKFDANGVKIQ